MKINIFHLYPDLLDLYGDRGNVISLGARCRWRGIDTEVHNISLGDDLALRKADILFIGGGSDREQGLLIEDLGKRKEELKAAIEDGLVLLTICGGYQLLGQYYQTGDNKKMPGLGILNLYTVAGQKRLIGNVIAEIQEELREDMYANYDKKAEKSEMLALKTLVGFENHSGKTYLGPELSPLGKVLKGFGNNGEDGWEGIRYKNVFGTYLHGPLLPKNPLLADLLIRLALERKGYSSQLSVLQDHLEKQAHQAVIERFGK